MIDFRCPGCDRVFRAKDSQAGKRGRCPTCQATFFVPAFVPNVPLVQVEEDNDGRPVKLMKKRDRCGPWFPLPLVLSFVAAGAFLVGNMVTDAGVGAGENQGRAAFGLVMMVAFLASPLVVPAILARTGALSIGRWLIMAGFCLATAALAGFLCFAGLIRSDPHPAMQAIVEGLRYGTVWLAIAVPGCLLAAAVYPKSKSQ